MKKVALGASGHEVQALAVGTYLFDGAADVLRATVGEVPVLVDTSDLYGTEPVVGEAARMGRDDMFVATKVFPDCYAPDMLRQSVHDSLGRLGLDHIDLLQLHWPNDAVPMSETIGAMEDLIDEGLLRAMGVCNHPVEALQSALAAATRHPVVSNQIGYSLYDRRFADDVVPFCEANGVTVVSYSPLGGRVETLLERDSAGVLRALATEKGVGPAEIALAWVMRRPGIIGITKSNDPERLRSNAAAAEIELTPAECQRLETSVQPRRVRSPREEAARRVVRGLMYHESGERTMLGRATHNARDFAVSIKSKLR